MTKADGPVALAAVAGAHGVKGEVRLKLFAESVESLQRHARVLVGDRWLTLASVRPGKAIVARFTEVADRNAAEALRGSLVSVPRSALPPLDEGEYYHADLIGMSCLTAAGQELGRVVSVANFGAGDIIEIEHSDGSLTMVPFRAGIAERDGNKIVIDAEFLG